MAMNIGVIVKPGEQAALDGIAVIQRLLPQARLLSEAEGHHTKELPTAVERVDPATFEQNTDLVVVFGGDGTLIHAASLLTERIVPILGINLGRIGFLTEVTTDELEQSLMMAVRGELAHSDRMRLDVEVRRGQKTVLAKRILNDAVLSRQSMSRITTFRVSLDDTPVTRIRGDGVLVCTPTGSTAYGMAAGGPILTPNLEAVGVIPICPIQLSQRPLVLKPIGQLRLNLEGDETVYATCDGQAGVEFHPDDVMIITRAKVPIRMLTVPWRDYYEMLRAKLRWGER